MKWLKGFVAAFKEAYARECAFEDSELGEDHAKNRNVEIVECPGEAPPVVIFHKEREGLAYHSDVDDNGGQE